MKALLSVSLGDKKFAKFVILLQFPSPNMLGKWERAF
jgi:hypothetical protein